MQCLGHSTRSGQSHQNVFMWVKSLHPKMLSSDYILITYQPPPLHTTISRHEFPVSAYSDMYYESELNAESQQLGRESRPKLEIGQLCKVYTWLKTFVGINERCLQKNQQHESKLLHNLLQYGNIIPHK